jgi:alpha-beta hydrolase superfamily lysophospholipase
MHMHPVSKKSSRLAKRIGLGTAAVALSAAALVANPTTSGAVENGPAPTATSVTVNGTFTPVTTQTVNPAGVAFNQGTIYTPSASAGVVGAVVITPGFTESQSAVSWFGPRLASHGFVVMTISTNSTSDQPSSRATQMKTALNWLVSSSSPVASRVDAARTALMGHSMGGGGTLEATNQPGLDAAIPLTPWDQTKSFANDRVPTLIIGGSADNIAPVAQHAQPFYNSIPAGTPKELAVISGGSHSVANSANAIVSRFAVSWLKRYVDGDTRYTQLACTAPSGLSSFQQATCS